MSHYWEIIAPVAVVAFGVVGLLARRLRRQTGEHRTGRGWPDDGIAVPAVVAEAACTLAETEEHRVRYGSMILAEERSLDWAARNELPPWAAPEADRYSGYGRNSGSSGGDYRGGSGGAGDGLPPGLEATLRRELHHVDDLDPGPGAGLFLSPGYNSRPAQSRMVRMKADSPAPAGLPREEVMPDGPGWYAPRRSGQPVTGAGDESEACGPPAPPAPLRPVDLALARCDLFMVAMRADHERWMAGARERWAA